MPGTHARSPHKSTAFIGYINLEEIRQAPRQGRCSLPPWQVSAARRRHTAGAAAADAFAHCPPPRIRRMSAARAGSGARQSAAGRCKHGSSALGRAGHCRPVQTWQPCSLPAGAAWQLCSLPPAATQHAHQCGAGGEGAGQCAGQGAGVLCGAAAAQAFHLGQHSPAWEGGMGAADTL